MERPKPSDYYERDTNGFDMEGYFGALEKYCNVLEKALDILIKPICDNEVFKDSVLKKAKEELEKENE